jgi:hypothetical protein
MDNPHEEEMQDSGDKRRETGFRIMETKHAMQQYRTKVRHRLDASAILGPLRVGDGRMDL